MFGKWWRPGGVISRLVDPPEAELIVGKVDFE